MKRSHICITVRSLLSVLLALFCCPISGAALAGDQAHVLMINSNAAVEKYRVAAEQFEQSLSVPAEKIDLGGAEPTRPQMAALNPPDIAYCIGAKAFHYGVSHFSDRPLIFSSALNWQRLPLTDNTYGISNELNNRMPIFLFRSIFPGIKKIGILYSRQYTLQWFENALEQAGELGVEIIGAVIAERKETAPALKSLLPRVDAVWLIPDPLVMPGKEYLYEILSLCDEQRVPIFSYVDLFVKLGAVMSVSVDNPTIGRQAAGIAQDLASGRPVAEKVQFPAGSNVTLNLKKVREYGLIYNTDALGLVNDIIK